MLLVAALLYLGWQYFAVPDAAGIIKRQLGQAVELLQVLEPEAPLEQLAKARRLAAYFSADCRFEWPAEREEREEPLLLNTRAQLQERILATRRLVSSLEIELEELDITVQAKKAKVKLIVNALGTLPPAADQFYDRHRFELQLVYSEERWLIASVRHLENLRPLSGELSFSSGDRINPARISFAL